MRKAVAQNSCAIHRCAISPPLFLCEVPRSPCEVAVPERRCGEKPRTAKPRTLFPRLLLRTRLAHSAQFFCARVCARLLRNDRAQARRRTRASRACNQNASSLTSSLRQDVGKKGHAASETSNSPSHTKKKDASICNKARSIRRLVDMTWVESNGAVQNYSMDFTASRFDGNMYFSTSSIIGSSKSTSRNAFS